MIWFLLLIPLCISGICLYFFKDKLTWWEIGLPTLSSVVLIFILKAIAIHSLTSDTCYHGSIITSARYYESWSTYVHQTCTRTCCCDSKGENCGTETYDCSYCDDNSAYWEAYDNIGNSFRITQSYYNQLKSRWHSNESFIDMNRSINYSFGCGKDGDAYGIRWDNNIQTSEPATVDVSYTNKVQTAKNAFFYESISDSNAIKEKLYKYPDLNGYKQECIIGLSKMNIPNNRKDSITKLFNFFNGFYGSKIHLRLFICLYYNKSVMIADKQESYWVGGNRNELTVCVGIDSLTNKLQWVKAFSWCDNKRIEVDCREDIMNLGTLDLFKVYGIVANTTEKNYKPKDFKEFDYLTVELPGWCYTVTIILIIISSGALLYWGITNEYEMDRNFNY